MTLDDHCLAAIHDLWDEMATLPASEPERGLRTLFAGVGDLIGSGHGLWLCAVRLSDACDDPMLGWRVRAAFFHGEMPADRKTYARSAKRLDDGEVDESTHNHVRQAGVFRATLLADHTSEGFFERDHYLDHYKGRGINDRLFVILPVNEDLESYFMFDRLLGEPNFSHRDLAIARYALRSLGWFNRQLNLSYGQLIAEEPLTPTERRTLTELLAGNAEKQIAESLTQSPHTTHQHVKSIFRKFNVRSRAELTALWLGH